MNPLPIDPLLPEILSALGRTGAVVVQAPPGAGKTTRVPPAVLELSQGREVWVSEPRRIAARLSARRVAAELGEPLGERVGYSVRFDDVGGPRTRLRYLTDGLLLSRLAAGDALPNVAAIVLDELHERRLAGDAALALVQRLRLTRRPDLGVVVMSATLDGDAVARFLACPRVESEGRSYPVAVEHAERPDDRPLDKRVASAVKDALRSEPTGDILVFLPGAREIRACMGLLEPFAAEAGVLLVGLHGELSLDEQARAVEPARRRKVVLATNVAESSVTIDGVTTVIDAGLERVATHAAWTGLGRLALAPVSRASAAQRAGRAGRTRPGRAVRLYSRADHDRRREHAAPEIERMELSDLVLTLRSMGITEPSELAWLTPPPTPALQTAERLLVTLGAVDGAGALTAVGKRMRALGVHPRLARLVVEGDRRGVLPAACVAAALLAERDIRRASPLSEARRDHARPVGPNDVAELAALFAEARAVRFDAGRLRALGVDAAAARTVDAAVGRLLRAARAARAFPTSVADDEDEALGLALTAAFGDRVARRRKHGSRELVLASGATAVLAETSAVHDGWLLCALEVEQVGNRTIVRLACRVEPEWLLELFPERLAESDELEWNGDLERVERLERLSFGSVVLDETRKRAAPGDAAARVLFGALQAAGLERWSAGAGLERLAARVRVASGVAIDMAELLRGACAEVTSFADLREVDLATRALGALPRALRGSLERLAPERVALGGGRTLPVVYGPAAPPHVSSRLQDFFGMNDGPRIGGGTIPLVLHMLAPNGRAVQVTSDLAGFWQRHYPSLRRELMRRYPRHSWPEDGASASPPPPGRLR